MSKFFDIHQFQSEAKTKWDSEPALHEEFTSFEQFEAYYLADKRGVVRILHQ